MKSTIVSMLIVLVVLAVVPMIFMGDNDLMSGFFGSGDGKESIASLKAKAPKNLSNVTTDKKVKVYKWVDENGVMQFSQTPPDLGGEHESMTLKPDTNLMKAFKAPEQEEQQAMAPKVFKTRSPYTPGGMKDMLNQTSDITDKLNQQQADQQKMLQEIMGKQ